MGILGFIVTLVSVVAGILVVLILGDGFVKGKNGYSLTNL